MPFYSDPIITTKDSGYRLADSYSVSGVFAAKISSASPWYTCFITSRDTWGPSRDSEFHASPYHGVYDHRFNPVTGALVSMGSYPNGLNTPGWFSYVVNDTLMYVYGNANGSATKVSNGVVSTVSWVADTNHWVIPGYVIDQVQTSFSQQGKAYTTVGIRAYAYESNVPLLSSATLTPASMANGADCMWTVIGVLAASEAYPNRIWIFVNENKNVLGQYRILRFWFDLSTNTFGANPTVIQDTVTGSYYGETKYWASMASFDRRPRASGGINYAYTIFPGHPAQPAGYYNWLCRYMCDDSADGWKTPTVDWINDSQFGPGADGTGGFDYEPESMLIVKKSDEGILKLCRIIHKTTNTNSYLGQYAFIVYYMDYFSRTTTFSVGKSWAEYREFHGRPPTGGWFQADGLPACSVWVQESFYVNYDGHGSHLLDFFTAPSGVPKDVPITMALGNAISIQVGTALFHQPTIIMGDTLGWPDSFKTSTYLSGAFKFQLVPNQNKVDIPITVAISCTVVINDNENDRYVAVAVNAGSNATVTVGYEVIQVVQLDFPINAPIIGLDYMDAVVDRLNATDRTTAGVQFAIHATKAPGEWHPTKDPFTIHAGDVLYTDIVAYDNVAFTDGYETYAERIAHLAASGIDSSAGLSFVPLTGAHDFGRYWNDSTMPSATVIADSIYNLVAQWVSTQPAPLVKKYQFWWGLGYGVPGPTVRSYVGTQHVNGCLVISCMMLEVAGAAMGIQENITVPPTEHWFQASYVTFGEDWHKAFLAEMNAVRATYGLKPYKLPTREIYEKYAEDVAQIHSQNQAITGFFGHESAPPHNYPAGYEYIPERFSKVRFNVTGWENCLVSFISPYYDENDPAVWGNQDLPIYNDYTLITPYNAFYAWWNSPGHRENILRNFAAELGSSGDYAYSFMGFAVGEPPTWNTLSNEAMYPENPPGLCTYFTNVVLDLEPALAQMDFAITYQQTGAPISFLETAYRLDCLTHVEGQHVMKAWAIQLAATHQSQYGATVIQTHEAPIHYTVAAQSRADYTQTSPVKRQHAVDYKIDQYAKVSATLNARYAMKVSAANSSRYEDVPVVKRTHDAAYDELVQVGVSHHAQYSEYSKVKKTMLSPYAVHYPVSSEMESPWMSTTPVKVDHGVAYDLLTINPVRGAHRGIWASPATASVLTMLDVNVFIEKNK